MMRRRPFAAFMLAVGLLLLSAQAPPAWGFISVAYDTAIDTAPRWSATEVSGRGLADGSIQVFVESGFAETLALAVTGMTLPEDVAAVEATIAAAFTAWESPTLHFTVTFDGAATRDATSGGEIDLFAVTSSDPGFPPDAFFGVTHMVWTFLANRVLTNGTVLAGNTIFGADILIAVDRLAQVAPALTREQQVRALQRLTMHEIGHAIGFGHAQDFPSLNFDTDTIPSNAMLLDPADPLASLILSPNVDGQAIMNRFPTDFIGLYYTTLRNDDRGGRDALYPALGAIQDICQPMPQPGCRAAQKALLQVRDDGSNTKDKLLWKWLKGAPTDVADFGDPAADTRYSFCLYKGALPLLIGEVALPPGGSWAAVTGKGFKYSQPDGLPHGARKTLLKAGAAGKAKIIFKAGGDNLLDGLLPIGTAPVVAQLYRNDTGTCWEGVYAAATVTADDSAQFKAKAQ